MHNPPLALRARSAIVSEINIYTVQSWAEEASEASGSKHYLSDTNNICILYTPNGGFICNSY